MDIAEVPAVSHPGAVLLTDTLHATGLAPSLRDALDPWTKPLAEHHGSKVLLDLAMTLAVGGEVARDTDLLRCEPGLFGHVASAPTISRTLTTLAEDAPAVIEAISRARRAARERAWALAGDHSPAALASTKNPLVIDLDATLINVHSEKEQAAPTFKRGFGYHPLCAFLDHGQAGTGEPLAIQLRPGNAGSNTASDHIAITREALAQLPPQLLGRDGRGSKKILIRTDGAGGTKDFVGWLERQRLAYSVGFTLPANTPELLERLDEAEAWTPAYDTDTDEAPWVSFRVSARRIGACPRSSVQSCVTVPCAWSTTAKPAKVARAASIRAVAPQLGVDAETLRIWCNRYGSTEPADPGEVIVMTPFESSVEGPLEGSHGGRAHVRDDHGATALRHYRGLNIADSLDPAPYRMTRRRLWRSTAKGDSAPPLSSGRSPQGGSAYLSAPRQA